MLYLANPTPDAYGEADAETRKLWGDLDAQQAIEDAEMEGSSARRLAKS
jgi:hypothetical protein